MNRRCHESLPIYCKNYKIGTLAVQGGPRTDRYKWRDINGPYKWPTNKWLTVLITNPSCRSYFNPVITGRVPAHLVTSRLKKPPLGLSKYAFDNLQGWQDPSFAAISPHSKQNLAAHSFFMQEEFQMLKNCEPKNPRTFPQKCSYVCGISIATIIPSVLSFFM